jgi:hypothetical protein
VALEISLLDLSQDTDCSNKLDVVYQGLSKESSSCSSGILRPFPTKPFPIHNSPTLYTRTYIFLKYDIKLNMLLKHWLLTTQFSYGPTFSSVISVNCKNWFYGLDKLDNWALISRCGKTTFRHLNNDLGESLPSG